MIGIGEGAPARGGTKTHPRACSRSAEPEDDVDARFPCYTEVKDQQAKIGDDDKSIDFSFSPL